MSSIQLYIYDADSVDEASMRDLFFLEFETYDERTIAGKRIYTAYRDEVTPLMSATFYKLDKWKEFLIDIWDLV